ncbi:MAG: hypothetical protein ACJ71X_11460 [Nitrososphaeraceae archaeon]
MLEFVLPSITSKIPSSGTLALLAAWINLAVTMTIVALPNT